MVELTRALAERISEVARLLETDDSTDAALRRLTELGIELVPGTTAAAVTIIAADQSYTFAASDARIGELHQLQFESGNGPVIETLRYNETRHLCDATAEQRWPAFCRAAGDAGYRSCLTLPLHTHRRPAGAVALYAERPDTFSGQAHDIALLFAAQGAAAIHNADLYGECRRMVHNLQVALESHAAIEQAKGILHAQLGISTDEAFQLLSQASQNTNQKVRDLAAKLVRGDISPRELRDGHASRGNSGPGGPQPA